MHATSITQHEVTLANVHRKFARAVDNELDQEDDRDHRDDRRRRRDRDEADHYGGPENDESWNFGKRSPQATWVVLAVVAGIVLFVFGGILTVGFTTIGVLGRTVQIQPVGPPPHPGPADPGRGNPVVPGPPAAFPDQAFLDELVETESTVGQGRLGKKGHLGFEFQRTPAEKNRLLFEGKPYDHALSTHPPSNGIARVKYRVEGHYRTLSGTAAMADLPPGSGWKESPSPITFRLWADGRVLWTSPALPKRGAKADFRVDRASVRELELHAVCIGQGHDTGTVWLNPQVSK